MEVHIHPHAEARLAERGATRSEVVSTVLEGERFVAKFDRTGFRRSFAYNAQWRGKTYATKQIEAYAVEEGGAWLVITVIARYF